MTRRRPVEKLRSLRIASLCALGLVACTTGTSSPRGGDGRDAESGDAGGNSAGMIDAGESSAGTTGTGGNFAGGSGAGGSAAGKTGTGGASADAGDQVGTGGSGGSTSHGSTAGVAVFFSDLTSGPNMGGQNDKGAFVTVFGNGFGDTRGASTVTIGGGTADNYPLWSNTKITFQLGPAAASGDIVVHTVKGDSGGVGFTVRAGNIFFVTAMGSDSSNGSYAAPWKTIPKAKNSLSPGDIAYLGKSVGDTVSQTVEDSTSPYRCALGMSANDGSNSGTEAAPKALVAYPGAKVTIGVEAGLERGILTPAISGNFDYWVISQLSLRGETEAIDLEGGAAGWRIVGNDISCPNGTGPSGCVTDGQGNDSTPGLKLFGNVVHDAAAKVSTVTKYYHGIYLASDHIELGWNTVRDGKTCRAIQFHDTGGPNEFDLRVHDNVVHGTVCDGINFATVDPSKGAVVAYNNVVYDVGNGPDPDDGSSSYACIYVANITNQGVAGSGKVQLFNNTLYNCGSRGTGAAGAVGLASGPVGIQMDDNLIAVLQGESFISGDSGGSPMITGATNLLFGGAAVPGYLTGTITGDPMFVSASAHDFHVQAGSAATDKGKPSSATTDIDGNPRPQGAAFDVGAYELVP